MLIVNVIGIFLSFLGTILTLLNVILSKPNKEGTTYEELHKLSPNQYKNKVLSIWGLSIMAVGFILQLYAATVSL